MFHVEHSTRQNLPTGDLYAVIGGIFVNPALGVLRMGRGGAAQGAGVRVDLNWVLIRPSGSSTLDLFFHRFFAITRGCFLLKSLVRGGFSFY